MKKLIAILFITLLSFVITGCSFSEENQKDYSNTEKKEETLHVDKRLLNVEITLPAFFF